MYSVVIVSNIIFMSISDKIKVNPQQKIAIEHGNGPLLIVAGAGTGKTTVLTQRVLHLIESENLAPDEILALTFTEKAAAEMQDRIDRELPFGYGDLWVMTFHSFAQKILERDGIDLGLPAKFKVLDESGAFMMMRKNLDRFDLDYYKPLGNPSKFIKELLKHFSRCKDELISPQEYLDYAQKLRLNNNESDDEGINFEIKKISELASAYHTYEQLLLDNDSLDFGDLITYCIKLFKERPNILKKYRELFKYILVDEFQDTNYAQYELIKMLAHPKNNITVVGDDDQCLPGNSKISTPSGEKLIKNIRVGDEVFSAIGKSHIGISIVNHVFKNKKDVNFLTIETKKGFKIRVTDNHKMFCYVPSSNIKGKFFYIYLMWRSDIGWRIGITRNLSWRLSLERSADKIIGIKSCKTEEEARFYEQLYSLKYSIPTYCFKHRKGLIIYEDKLKELYKQLDVDCGIQKLAKDLNIDLNSFHICLSGVIRGSKERIKINLNMCQRRHRSKDHVKNKRESMKTYLIQHEINIQTSSKRILEILSKNGYKLQSAKIGKRLRIVSNDLLELKKDLKNLENITGGVIQARARIGKLNYQTLPALVMPAKNLLLGHYLPVKINNEIIYDEIIDIKEHKTNSVVYDLEIDKTHNFLAEKVVVHNSIYAFRGSSMNNILGFKKDYSDAKEVLLTKNYRSAQNILDLSYNFIQQNNPERLEIKLSEGMPKGKKLSKKLGSQVDYVGEIAVIQGSDENDEARKIIEKIYEILKVDTDNLSWNDFAILTRANASAKPIIGALKSANIPYQYIASSGLYEKEIIVDIVSYLRLLDNYHESSAMWRVLNFRFWQIPTRDAVNISHMARKKSVSIYEIIRNPRVYLKLSSDTEKKLKTINELIEKHTDLALKENIWAIVWTFLNDSGYLKWIDSQDEFQKQEIFSYLNQFYKKIQLFIRENDSINVKDFLIFFDMELESGDSGKLTSDVDDGPEGIKVMTVHGAKGLEFKYVFIISLVDKRFPSMERGEAISIPDKLIREVIPGGDVHLQEERRLFYVAMTRAKKGLYFTWALDYGGTREKKPSRFLHELELIKIEEEFIRENKNAFLSGVFEDLGDETIRKEDFKKLLPKQYSFSQLKAYETCPRQYYYSHILKIPVSGKGQFSYGKTMHLVLQKFFQLYLLRKNNNQSSLFESNKKNNFEDKVFVSREELFKLYEESWQEDWFLDDTTKQKYWEMGRVTLEEFYSGIKANMPKVKYLEKGFNFKVDNYSFKGEIDRVDEVSGGVEIIDYKTGEPKEKLSFEDKEQLFIYQMAYEEIFKEKVVNLKFYYLNNGTEVNFIAKEKDIIKIKEKLLKSIEGINSCDFSANPNSFICKYCDFKNICPFKE